MLNEDQLEMFSGQLTGVFQQLEQTIINDIARRVRKSERWTETAELQAGYLRDMGWSPTQIRLEVIRTLNASPDYVRWVDENTLEAKRVQQEAIDEAKEALRRDAPELFEAVGNMAFNNDLSLWKEAGQSLRRGTAVDALVTAMQKRATDDLLNLTGSLAFRQPVGTTIPARRAFAAAMNDAITQVVSGTVSYQQACTNAVRSLARSGLRWVDYESGVTRQLDTAARNAVLTASGQLAGDIMQTNIEQSGVTMVQVSRHWGARDSHAAWQGGIYTLEQFRVICGYGEPSNPDHIYSYNCRHVHYPYWPGISEPVEYAPEPGPFEVNGKRYTYYQATQRQRAMERDIRALKREALAQEALGDKTALAAAKLRIDEKVAQYKAFSRATNLREKVERTAVLGYDKAVAARAQSALVNEMRRLGVSSPDAGLFYRRSDNPGVFSVLPERMSKKHIREIAREYGISLNGLSLEIDFDEDKLRDAFLLTGRADTFSVGRIDFFPRAFSSKEELLRTLYHERIHVLQFKEFGTEYVQANRAYFETLAYQDENEFIAGLRSDGRI